MTEPITYRLDQFEGPLDLLLSLIAKNKVSITDIPIALICDQYMEYIREAQRMDLDVASEFIVMASELMLIKSRMILPHEEGTENDPRREIQNALLLYRQAKIAAKEMRVMYEEYSGRYVKGTDDVPPERGLPLNLDANMMLRALQAVMRRMKVAEAERKPTDLVNPLIKHHVVSVEEKIEEICELLEEHEEASMFFLLKDADSRPELVARFMGILELIKIHRIMITTYEVVDGNPEYSTDGLSLKFSLNPDYVPAEGERSEFDTSPEEETASDSTEKTDESEPTANE